MTVPDKNARYLAGSLCMTIALALTSAEVLAQDPPDGGDTLEEIVVTGSRLVRRDLTSPSPIVSIDRDAILASGQATIEETINVLPQVQPAYGRSSNHPGDGTSQVDLRGIGAGRTLVMLNGRRVAPAGIGSAVDINTLPAILVERIEIITGGATAVYGSDAVAGVVNVITREDFEGFGFESSFYTTERGDSDILDINASWGKTLDAGSLTLYGGYLDREASLQSERSFSAQTYTDNWFTNTLSPGGSTHTPAGGLAFPRVDFGNGPARTIYDADGNPREFRDPEDRYDYGPVNYLQVPLKRYSLGALATFDLRDDLELYSELAFTRNQVVQNIAPGGAFGAFVSINLDNPVLTPANRQFLTDNAFPLGPNLVGIGLSRRITELGPRIVDSENDYSRLLAGVRGELTERWDFDAWVSYTRVEEEEFQRNDGLFSRLQQGLLVDPNTGECFDPSGGCVPLNVFGPGNLSAAGVDFIRAEPFRNIVDREQTLVSAFIRGDLVELPAGSVAIALGAEWREDTGSFIADDVLFSGDTLGFFADSNVEGKESVSEIYAEALVPLLADTPLAQHLGIEIGGRLSNYRNAGELDTWKLGADWEPVEGLRFRTMLQRSARAPNLGEAFLLPFEQPGAVVFFDPREDPCSASADPVGNGLTDVCVAQGIPADQLGTFEAAIQFPVITTLGGNNKLAPEVAETFTAGFVFSRFDSWSLAVDYYDIDVEDTIGSSSPMTVCFDPANTARVSCDRIGRDPQSYDVNAVDARNANLGQLRTTGFDTLLQFGTEVRGWLAAGLGSADLDISIAWTHVTENSVQADPAATMLECVGKFGFACRWFGKDAVYPENRVATNLAWRGGDWSGRLGWRWIEGTSNSARDTAVIFGIPPDFVDPVIDNIGAKSYVDLSASYFANDNLTLSLTIANLLDEKPAFLADNATGANTHATMYDVFGRAYTLRVALNYQ